MNIELCSPEEQAAGFSAYDSGSGIVILKRGPRGDYKVFEELRQVPLAELHEMLKEYVN